MKERILKDKTDEMIRSGKLPHTHRPYRGFDSYVETYKNFKGKPYQVIMGKFGSGKEMWVYAQHKAMLDINPIIIGNGQYHIFDSDPSKKTECMVSMPLNGVMFLKREVKSNICLDGLPDKDVFDYMERNNNIYDPSYLKTYAEFCGTHSMDSSGLNLEYGDMSFLFNPILSIKFSANVDLFYEKSAQFIFNVYSLLRYHQYKQYGIKLKFDFNRNQYFSGLCTFLAYPDFEYKILLPNEYGLLANDLIFNDAICRDINFLLSQTISTNEKFLSLATLYGEIWELLLMGEYEMIIIKTLGFLQYFLNCKRLRLVPNAISTKYKLNNMTELEVKEFFQKLIEKKNNIVHEADFRFFTKVNCGEKVLEEIADNHKEDCITIIEVMNALLNIELEKGDEHGI